MKEAKYAGQRLALIIATSEYSDKTLNQLKYRYRYDQNMVCDICHDERQTILFPCNRDGKEIEMCWGCLRTKSIE